MAELYERELFVFNQVPVKIFNHFFEREDIFTPLHWHRNIEFNLTTGGRIGYMIDGRASEQYPGEWNVVNSGALHSNRWIQRGDIFEGIAVQISKSFMDTWLGKDIFFSIPKEEETRKQGTQILEQFGMIKKAEVSDTLEEMELLFHFMRYLKKYCIDTDSRDSTSRTKAVDNIKCIINYLDQPYMEDISLTSVAEEFHYTPAHLSRLFKEHIGFNFHEYLQNIRLLNCVNKMKKYPDIRLISCALDNGFPNARSFIQTFKKTFGCTPSEWMKK